MPINNPTGSGLKIFTSGPQNFSQGGGVTIAHNLGVKPKFVTVTAKCIVAENNYAVGDEIYDITFGFYSTVNGVMSSSIFIDSGDVNNIKMRFANNAAFIFVVANKTSGNGALLTPANWQLYVTVAA